MLGYIVKSKAKGRKQVRVTQNCPALVIIKEAGNSIRIAHSNETVSTTFCILITIITTSLALRVAVLLLAAE